MCTKYCFVLSAVAVCVGVAWAQPDAKKVDEKNLVTRVYNVKHLIGERGKASGYADTDAISKLIFQTIDFGKPKEVPQVIERDGDKLEIHASADSQREIGDLLDALERLQDVAIDVKAEVFAFDAAAYEKFVKVLPKGKTKSPILLATGEEHEGDDAPALDKSLAEVNKVLKTGRLVQTSTARLPNGVDATISSRRSILRFTGNGSPAWKATEKPLFVKDGFTLTALPVVSVDRRFIRFKLTEQSTAVTGIRKRNLGEIGGQKIVVQSPITEDTGAIGSAEVVDGGTAIFKLAYAPKDKVWVVVVKATIFIQAEADELQRLRRLEDKVKRVFPRETKKPGS